MLILPSVEENMILCDVNNFKPTIPINKTEEKYFRLDDGINLFLLKKQHKDFYNSLVKNNINVNILQSDKDCPEQVFIRDIAFNVKNTWCICNMSTNVRKKEPLKALEYFKIIHPEYRYYKMKSKIEGGDVLIYNNIIFLGISNRTSIDAFNELKLKFKDYTIVPIYLKNDMLHLDCVLGNINDNHAFVFKNGIDENSYNKLSKYFNIIEITKSEQEHMATNFLKVNNVIFCEKSNKRINQIIKEFGFKIEEIAFSEFHKLGGSLHCCSLEFNN